MTSENIKEGSAEIPCDDSVFYNPIQEFNRDMSIAAISVWSEMYLNEIFSKKCTEEPPYQEFHPVELPPYSGNDSLQKKHREKLQIQLQALGERFSSSGLKVIDLKHERMSEYQFSIYEGLSASGLRSIRYAKELYNVSKIVANDYSEKAVKAITRNAEFNQVAHIVNAIQGDCSKTMYRYMCNQEKFHVIDLDPYGTAAPFLDAAIQAVKSGGLLCVTCTDMAVLAGPRPEACFAKYGSVNIPNAPFTHELALRILLNTIQGIASRYKKSITPLLSCSIDYYVRVFVRVYDSAIDTKNCAR